MSLDLVHAVTRTDVEALTGRPVSDEELMRVRRLLRLSLPGCLVVAVDQVCGVAEDGDTEVLANRVNRQLDELAEAIKGYARGEDMVNVKGKVMGAFEEAERQWLAFRGIDPVHQLINQAERLARYLRVASKGALTLAVVPNEGRSAGLAMTWEDAHAVMERARAEEE